MKIGEVRKYNEQKRGSYMIAVWMTDWELAILIKALKMRAERYKENKAIQTWTEKRVKTLGKALSKVLKAELRDLKARSELLDKHIS